MNFLIIFVSALPEENIPTTSLTEGLLAYYPFEEGLGITTEDRAGDFDLELISMDDSNWVEGKVGEYALEFNGGEYAIREAIVIGLLNEFSVQAWVNSSVFPFPTSGQVISLINDAEDPEGFSIAAINGNGLSFCVFNGGVPGAERNCAIIAPLDSNRWYHVIGVYNGSHTLLYINGELYSSNNQINGLIALRGNLSIGRHSILSGGERFWNGIIDEATIWERAITREEIEQLYNGGNGVPNLIDIDRDGYRITDDCDDNNPNVNPAAIEICNSIDDNCNNEIDEGFSIGESCGVGLCSSGVFECSSSNDAQCSTMLGGSRDQSSDEICDGLDNDCDGEVDENIVARCYTGSAETRNVGICHGGTLSCFNGKFGACIGEVTPQIEICDGLDNNCDGETDEEFSDNDNDTSADCVDNCLLIVNANQSDLDSDSTGDICDNCPNDSNLKQEDLDGDNVGDICDVQSCGNNIRERPKKGIGFNYNELCDGSDFGGITCENLGFNFGSLMCSADCNSYNIAQCHNCGNGNINPSEECDDGNIENGDGCSSVCLIEEVEFIRGDANTDGRVDISDAIKILNFLFWGTGDITCLDAADANDDGRVDISDPSYILGFSFLGENKSPPEPYPEEGTDPTPDNLECNSQ